MDEYRIELNATHGYACVQVFDADERIVGEQNDLTVPEALDYITRTIAEQEE